MKIAVISDIHSNVYALEAVLSDIDQQSVDMIVNLGDTLWGMVDPLATAELLMAREDIIHIMGNGDEMLLMDDVDATSYEFAKPLLNKRILDWLSTFHNTYSYKNILCFHASPSSKYDYLTSMITDKGMVQKPLEQLDIELKDISAEYIMCGHDHKCKTIITPKGKMIIDPGSVGLPAYADDNPLPHKVESFTNFAKYSIVTYNNEKVVKVEHCEVKYDWYKACAAAKLSGSKEYADSISTGRVVG